MRLMLCLLVMLLPLSAHAQGDVLQIPLSQQGDSKLPRPGKGMSKTEVEQLFGAPISSHGPVGTPPISRWQYAEYTVIFEYDHVVHTVLKHKPKAPIGGETTAEPAPESKPVEAIPAEVKPTDDQAADPVPSSD